MHSGAEKLNLAYSADFNVTQTFRFDKSLSSDDLSVSNLKDWDTSS